MKWVPGMKADASGITMAMVNARIKELEASGD